MGIFTSQKTNLQDLPNPSESAFGSLKNLNLPSIKEGESSVPEFDVKETKNKKQIFVKMDHYKEALDTINKIRNKIKDADVVLNDLKNIKEKEDQHLIKWHKDLEDIKERLSRMDKVLYEIEHD